MGYLNSKLLKHSFFEIIHVLLIEHVSYSTPNVQFSHRLRSWYSFLVCEPFEKSNLNNMSVHSIWGTRGTPWVRLNELAHYGSQIIIKSPDYKNPSHMQDIFTRKLTGET